jgi:pyruvyl transferase EpsO
MQGNLCNGPLADSREQVLTVCDDMGPFWNTLQAELSQVLTRLIPQSTEVVYVDYPVHTNVGDLLILLGTERYISQQCVKVLGRWHRTNFRFPKIAQDVVVLLHGGGNFGDLYPHQAFRESVSNAYPKNRIIYLPQTIHYEHKDSLLASAEIVNKHPDTHLLVRDHRSLEFARLYFSACKSYLAPDMSVCLYPLHESLELKRNRILDTDTLFLLRTDREQVLNQDIGKFSCGWRGDWKELLGVHRLRLRYLQVLGRAMYSEAPARWFAQKWHIASCAAVLHCSTQCLRARKITSSRLHGHILASLLGIPNVLLDNNYGKNAAYFQTWHQSLRIARFHRLS